MNLGTPGEIRRLMILKSDRLYAEALQRAARGALPAAEILLASRVHEVTMALRHGPLDLLVTGLDLVDGDMLDFLAFALPERAALRRVLVATSQPTHRVLVSLASLPVDGVFDCAAGGLDEFVAALQAVAAGEGYWSRTIEPRTHLLLGRGGMGDGRYLTPVEQLVFSVIGDGCDDAAAAERLGLKRSTVHGVRRELHRKLGVRHKGELVRLAVQNGYVRFTRDAVQRPGFAMLRAGCARRSIRKAA